MRVRYEGDRQAFERGAHLPCLEAQHGMHVNARREINFRGAAHQRLPADFDQKFVTLAHPAG